MMAALSDLPRPTSRRISAEKAVLAVGYPAASVSRATKTAGGFTLLEALVALVIMAVIMTTAFGALRMSGRGWEAGVARASDNETYRAVAHLLRRQVSQAIAMSWPEGTEKRVAFEGTPERLRFLAPAPQQYTQAGLFEYGLTVQREGLDQELVLSYIPFNPDAEAFKTPARHQQVVLVKGLEDVSFEYFGSPAASTGVRGATSNEPPRWYRSWDEKAPNLPTLIRVRLSANEGQQPWPDLYLSLAAGGSQ